MSDTSDLTVFFYRSKYLIKHDDDWIRTIATTKVVYSAEIDENNACHKNFSVSFMPM